MNRSDFEALISQALDELPPEFASKLDNVDIVVEEWPTQAQLHSVGLTHPQTLFGLYQGIPQTKRRNTFQLPDKISIFAGPILRSSREPSEVREKVIQVVKHEIAHHFGMDEHAIRRRGY